MKKSNPYEIERTERRISAASSIAMCALTVIAQIAVTLLLAVFLRDKATIVYVVLEWIGAAAAIWVYRRPGSPSYKLAWMCLLLALPVSGMLLFCLLVATVTGLSATGWADSLFLITGTEDEAAIILDPPAEGGPGPLFPNGLRLQRQPGLRHHLAGRHHRHRPA